MDEEIRMPKPRIESLSDLVFGLALSIGGLTLLGTPPHDPGEVTADIAWFALSFFVLISVWIRYTDVMSVLPLENWTAVTLNVLLLFLVCVEPYLFDQVSLYGHTANYQVIDYASIAYALDMTGMATILALFTHVLTIEERQLILPKLLSRYRHWRNHLFVSGLLFLVTVLPPFWSLTLANIPIRFIFWLVPISAFWINRA